MLAMSKSLFSPPVPPTFASLHAKTHLSPLPQAVPYLLPKRRPSLFIARADDNGAGAVVGTAVEEKPVVKEEEIPPPVVEEKEEEPEKKPAPFASNGAAAAVAEAPKFKDPRWVAGTWDLSQFRMKSGETDWDAVIDAEARRRKWLEDNPESSSNDDPVLFNTSTIPWWAWMKRYHLPEAELLNGRAAMVGFFMAYFVDGLTGVGLVDQMGNFFCKTLLLIAVAGVLLIRKNEDVETLKKLFEETTFYDKQWQATWQDDNVSASNKEQS